MITRRHLFYNALAILVLASLVAPVVDAGRAKPGGGTKRAKFPKALRRNLYCGVCVALCAEMEAGMARTTDTGTVQVRWRIDEKRRIPAARTEHRLMEILEEEMHGVWKDYGVTSGTLPVRAQSCHTDRTAAGASLVLCRVAVLT
jgi:hypothetical protein